MVKGKVTALVLLDLFAASDTILHRLEHWLGLARLAVSWFASYPPPSYSICTYQSIYSKRTTTPARAIIRH